jgi:hypothetical protein
LVSYYAIDATKSKNQWLLYFLRFKNQVKFVHAIAQGDNQKDKTVALKFKILRQNLGQWV